MVKICKSSVIIVIKLATPQDKKNEDFNLPNNAFPTFSIYSQHV